MSRVWYDINIAAVVYACLPMVKQVPVKHSQWKAPKTTVESTSDPSKNFFAFERSDKRRVRRHII